MSAMDIINYMKISDSQTATVNQQRLDDLQGKADFIEKKTGQPPVSWYEFQQQVPEEKPKTLRNMISGAVMGLGVGGMIGAVLAITFGGAPIAAIGLIGALIGGAAGAFSQTDATIRQGQIEKYSQYLDQFAMEASRAPAKQQSVAQEKSPEPVTGKHVERLMQERAAAEQAMAAGR